MSIEAHPNIHAVKLGVGLMMEVIHGKVDPLYVQHLFSLCVRGEAATTADIAKKVDLDGMVESLQLLVNECLKRDDKLAVGDYICSFCAELSDRLDRAVEGIGATD
jgi:hypothetical protein